MKTEEEIVKIGEQVADYLTNQYPGVKFVVLLTSIATEDDGRKHGNSSIVFNHETFGEIDTVMRNGLLAVASNIEDQMFSN